MNRLNSSAVALLMIPLKIQCNIYIQGVALFKNMAYAKGFLTFEEIQQMLSVPDLSERDEIIILLLYAPALRVSEMLNLRVADLDLKNETITIRGGKGWDVTDLDVVPCDVKILRKVLRYCEHEHRKSKDFVIQSNMDKKMHRAQVYRI